MNRYRKLLLTATSAVGLLTASAAQAGVAVYPSAQIHGNGASSIINVLNKTWQCLGEPDNPIGKGADGSTLTFPSANYVPPSPTTANPVYHCGSTDQNGNPVTPQSIQSTITGYYVSTGSGGGKTDWSKFTQSGITSLPPSFSSAYADGHIQYAFSDSAISSTNLSDYNNSSVTTSPVSNGTGPAIQIPFYVLPVAVSYAPVYGKRNIGGSVTPLSLHNHFPATVTVNGTATAVGGIHMTKAIYCGIMNGTITNWNDPALKTANGGVSLMDPNDDPTRWSSIGVPIKLVGRSDNSGTTNIFTRALAAQCPGTDFSGLGGTDQLPAARKGTATYNSSGALTGGTETPGKFGLAPGNDGVAATVGQTIPDSAVPNPGDVALSGYVGYNGGDFVLPATLGTATPALYAAALQVGTAYKLPTAVNASAAFGTTYLPPQSDSTGKYCPDSPTVACTRPAGSQGSRTDPTAWVLPASATTGLANPTTGYPIVGTTQALLYTCYNSQAKRLEIQALAALQLGRLTTWQNAANEQPVGLVNSTAKGADGLPLGILARNGIANLPTAWKNAIWETFFTKVTSGNNPASLNLWILDKVPTTTGAMSTVTRNTAVCPLDNQGA